MSYKDFKKRGGKLDQGMGALKKGDAGTPLQTMGTSRPIKRQLTVYNTSRPRGVNKNEKTFRKQKQKPKQK